MVSRRQFFTGFWKEQRVARSEEDRNARYQLLESYVQAELRPTDFALTEAEKSQLSKRVRSFLKTVSDDDLFSANITGRLKLLVEDFLEPWQMANAEVVPRKQPQELRIAAIESVPLFLNAATRESIDAMMKQFALVHRVELEARLRAEVAKWVQHMPDSDLIKYDSQSIQDPVFRHLREFMQSV